MDFKKLFISNKAVSPVIGVVLMVAITVILAAA
ncbi:MAG: archaellin/type IV pilin N-terminal domain-containing protein, partial [Methanosarcina flavescens]